MRHACMPSVLHRSLRSVGLAACLCGGLAVAVAAAAVAAAAVTAAAATAAPAPPTAQDAVAMAERGARVIRQYGKQEMMDRINRKDPAFFQGSLYLAMRDLNGITLAHPTRALIGKDLLDVPDADGKPFRREMLAVARGSGKGWVSYKFRNPASGKVEAKTTYVLRVDDVALEAGIYAH